VGIDPDRQGRRMEPVERRLALAALDVSPVDGRDAESVGGLLLRQARGLAQGTETRRRRVGRRRCAAAEAGHGSVLVSPFRLIIEPEPARGESYTLNVFDPQVDATTASILPDLALLRGSDASESDILRGATACRHFIDVPIRVFHPRLGQSI
jgi:hypothetical protein